MRKFLSAVLAVLLVPVFSLSSYAEKSELTTAAPWYIIDSVSSTFYIDANGIANVSYVITSEKCDFSVTVYVEKKVSPFVWKKVGTPETVKAETNYLTGLYTVKVDGDGEYRAVIAATPEKDKIKHISYCTYNSAVYYGDMDDDGKITASDARIILRIGAHLTAGTVSQKKKADINGDGKINSIDARRVLRIAAKLD